MSKLKVVFVDNSESQYDENADRIKVKGTGSKGKLYLGDRFSAAMLQLKFRDCKRVVNCCTETHGLAREADVKYLKIDPDDDDGIEQIFEDSYRFIDDALTKDKNVVVHCENGNIKSGAIILYYVMKKQSISLAESYRIVQKYREGLKIKPSLVSKLTKAEKSLRGSQSLMHDGKKVVFLDEGIRGVGSGKKKAAQSSPVYILLGVGAFFAVVFGAIFMATGKI
jgi:hypothetical protein